MTCREVRSVCPYCGVGCGIVMEVKDQKIVRVKGDASHPVNKGRLCTKGSTCHEPVTSSARLDTALIRSERAASPVPVSLDAAIETTAKRLRSVLETHGPDAIALYVSGQMSLEAQYLANKLVKGYLRTRHIESNSRLCMAAAGTGYKLSLGADAPPGSYEDFDCSNLFFVIGANMADCHPILFLRLMDRKRASGAKLIVVDPRRTATADKADLFLQIRPGTDLALLNCLLLLLIELNAIDEKFIEASTRGWGDMSAFLADYTPDRVSALTGLSENDIRTAARWIAEAKDWMSLWTMGLNQSVSGAWHTNALCNLHLATGAICRPGSGPFSLTGQPNAMGGREMGYMGPGLPGQRTALTETDRSFCEEQWKLPPGTIRSSGSDGAIAMFRDMAEGAIKACWIICTNPVATVPRRGKVRDALEAAELVIVQDAYADAETGRYADILLPGALWAEGDGVQVSSDRTMTLARQAVAPPGEALPDWQIIARVACAMGFSEGFSFASSAEIFAEAGQFTNSLTGYDISGVSHSRLQTGPVQWPAAEGDLSTRHPVRYRPDMQAPPVFAHSDGKAVFLPRPWMAQEEQPDEHYPFLLNTGRLQHQWHTLTKTGRVMQLNKLNSGPFIEISPDDAKHTGISDKDLVEIRSVRGRALLPAHISSRVAPGTCFAPFHWNDRFGEQLCINEVTSDAVDPLSLQPGIKHCAVSLTLIGTASSVTQERTDIMPADFLAQHLNLTAFKKPEFSGGSVGWINGFLEGLRLTPPENTVPVIPPSAPLSSEQVSYLNGLLTSLYSRLPAVAPRNDSQPASSRPALTLWWASQTGRAEILATQLSSWLSENGYDVRLAGLEGCSPDDLTGTALFVVSTFGDGEAPDSAVPFWNMLQQHNTPLTTLRYAVLALGDSAYASFCGFGRLLDKQLSSLGAFSLLERAECEPDYDDVVETWQPQLLKALGDEGKGTDTKPLMKQPLCVSEGITRDTPVTARLVKVTHLSGEEGGKETCHVELDISGTGLNYTTGDALGVWPLNNEAIVQKVLKALQLAENTMLTLRHKGAVSLGDALRRCFDLSRPAPALLKKLGLTESGYLPDLISTLTVPPSEQEIPGLFRRMQPRLYSVSSSSRLHPERVHLTVGVNYTPFPGVSSTWLTRLKSGEGVSVFIQPSSHFRLPEDDSLPVIMIGPGTGIAPFRAFLQERAARQATGPAWLFFGERHEKNGFYYRSELEDFMAQGYLTRLDTAFSRDQDERIYVQDRMNEHSFAMWEWINQGACLYVCGDAARMARDVDDTLKQIVSRHGAMGIEQAGEFLAELARSGRYLRDVY
ncbi:bifunctional nitrate reductase/sulfite reductase flavoprotein subunit alpha [Acetobacter thailandicus]|uniref:bifunctional nitrate reductase/sulfite reductase flavoprotein subunit alpha n=1 Tax=Acetobacter thailandicus TaxID=1502842 RepID=UPI001BACBD0C|nr:bifunctional nitrate reductase/sulfite reductase flavoprotein subunit alpha [Acetobacter thailandicus]MBS0960484.1 bifunctional nitrate reductase/sulfite reductase flavoprotein subunit alpha [Acetobacter thailandicus]